MIYSFPSSALNEFRLSEEQIIENFTRNQNGSKQDTPQLVCAPKRDDDPLNEYLHQRPPNEVERRRMPVLAPGRDLAPTDHITLNCNNFDNARVTDYPIEILLRKIKNLENEKKYLLKSLENKQNVELEYRKALETQAAFVSAENKKSQFYENEWLHMKSQEHSFMTSGKSPMRKTLELFYEDDGLYKKLGRLTSTQEIFIANLIEDHKNLALERNSISRKYQEAVDANFQLYQQNEMLKAQNINLVERNKDAIDHQMEEKLVALNASLIHVQKENIQLREKLDQYTQLIENIEKCYEVNSIKEELTEFKKYLLK
ncbi:conserved Plasmodium protein, unknown function [Plasmodium knowlesi strain H]|uniref:Uncharacterized protein n=3 Tax=Plasmodium knowlesi TaxID=5850 RepID=A0A1A7VT56_PLAKH|nr:conserved Plasmodium protein, unknown function [Plasmodium knowlesi strain H]OTN66828.1 Uncharacterized protein PKNOH_S08503000 [Plasmodium knowlesi]CAA9986701.1 conserved Plasmodium protein, unknown function [Plasmodium knowlesi strain H]SBO23515.1 conserved Plasmodium protein, unknown function [Plasmodium knowlesi strain H]SBO25011.1 conserved Plasmodium protein, unknown function [Plasmodium knowlesi strain H]VVS76175.1 conserved Plasmodium protein, unknown function [Plasmodium knowlesi s